MKANAFKTVFKIKGLKVVYAKIHDAYFSHDIIEKRNDEYNRYTGHEVHERWFRTYEQAIKYLESELTGYQLSGLKIDL